MADSVKLNTTIIENAKQSIVDYETAISELNGELATEINNLRGENFVGEASDGYNDFYTGTVVPALTDTLTQVTSALKDLLEDIQSQFFDSVDTPLGNANREAGSGGTTTA